MTSSDLFTGPRRDALCTLIDVVGGHEIVLVGASALFWQMSRMAEPFPAWRRTEDIDLMAAIDREDLQGLAERLSALGWRVTPGVEHQFLAPSSVRLDIVPAGEALRATGELRWPSGHVMNLAGVDLAFVHHDRVPLDGGRSVATARVPVLVLLKMVAWLDRPSERSRDLGDIAFVLDHYASSERSWWDEAFDEVRSAVQFEHASAWFLGEALRGIVRGVHRDLVERFVASVTDQDEWHYSEMRRLRDGSSARDEDDLLQRWEVFLHAFRR